MKMSFNMQTLCKKKKKTPPIIGGTELLCLKFIFCQFSMIDCLFRKEAGFSDRLGLLSSGGRSIFFLEAFNKEPVSS